MEENRRESFEDIDGLGFVLSAAVGAVITTLVGGEVGSSILGRLGLGAVMGAGVYVSMPIVRLLGKGLDAALDVLDRKLGRAQQRSRSRARAYEYEKKPKRTIPKKVQKFYDTNPKFQEYIAARQREEYKHWEDRGKPGFFGPTPLNPLEEYRKFRKKQADDEKFAKQQARNVMREERRLTRIEKSLVVQNYPIK